ncbi:MAG: nucleotidyltransferase domain-containing protein [Candidatus Lokiarchaeota archaeon]
MIEKIKKDLKYLDGKYETILFGSFVEGGTRPKSDIDIAIISKTQNNKDNIRLQKEFLGLFPQKYDIRIFEILPIHIQISIINNYMVIFGNKLEISEYFYLFRKKWDDCKHRILTNQYDDYKERLSAMDNIK